jgi:hypothetical protein
VAEVVVDCLEVVKVEEEHGRLGRESPVATQELLDAIDDEGPAR